MVMMASECAARLLEIVAQQGDMPLGHIPDPGFGYREINHLEVQEAQTKGHWEENDSPALGERFIAFKG